MWANNRIYDGLTTNSPLLTYEIPDFPYSDDLRKTGRHVKAEEVNRYLQDYAEKNSLVTRIKFHHHVQEISWDSDQRLWIINGHTQNQSFCLSSTHLVICTGLYHAAHVPPSLQGNNVADFAGNVWHSSQVSNLDIQQALAGSGDIVVVGAGKSAIDLATLLAQGQWSVEDSPTVNLVYRQPHWLSPRNILHNTVAFEKILFCRFVVSLHWPELFQVMSSSMNLISYRTHGYHLPILQISSIATLLILLSDAGVRERYLKLSLGTLSPQTYNKTCRRRYLTTLCQEHYRAPCTLRQSAIWKASAIER